MSKVFLGIDAGTSVLKACAFSADGEILAKAQRPVQIITPRHAWAEIDVEHYWQLALAAIREALDGLGPVDGIGVSATCPTTIFMDAGFRPLRAGILYLDGRSDELVRAFAGGHGGGRELFRRVGNHPSSSTCWLGNLRWLREYEPEVWKRTRRIGLLGSFIVQRLAGSFTLDWTQASYSGGFDISRPERGWLPGLLRDWKADADMLPELGPSHRAAGELLPGAARDMGVVPGAPVAFGSADTAAAAFAVGLRRIEDVLETSGTSGVLTFCLDRPDFDEAFMNRCHILPGRWLAHGAMSTLGGAFAWMKNKVWPESVSVAELEQLAAESPAGANGLIFLPYLAGERSPIWDPDASGAWIGLRLDSTRADMARAVFEGTAYGLRQMLERAKKRWGLVPREVLSVGGGSRSRFWARIKREVTGLDYRLAEKPDAGAWGAALLGAIASGEFSGPDDARIRFILPNRPLASPSRSERMRLADLERKRAYDKAFRNYEKLYPALRPVMHDLAKNDGEQAGAVRGHGIEPVP
ncbi:MAG: XylB [Planctomycetota bacterium]|jgi:xylulokinase|nr:XylB [Planctomycetota bacterium]